MEAFILEACDYYDPTFLYLVVMSRTAGLRRGEMAGLMWGDIDWDKKEVHLFGKGQRHRTSFFECKSGSCATCVLGQSYRHR